MKCVESFLPAVTLSLRFQGKVEMFLSLGHPSQSSQAKIGYSPWGHKESDTTERLLSLNLVMGED